MKAQKSSEYKGKQWNQARIKAQSIANKTGATYYAFPDYDGSIAIEIDYPKSGVQFETFNPGSASVASDKPLDGSPRNTTDTTNGQATLPILSKNVARSLRHKLNMVWLRDHKGGGWYDGKSDECNHEVAYVYNAIAGTYASKNYAGALWLDRELKLKQAYERAVETVSMSDQWPTRPLLYRLYDEAACYATNPPSAISD